MPPRLPRLVGALGAVLVVAPSRPLPARRRVRRCSGVGTAGLARFLVGDDDLELLFTEREGIVLVGVGTVAVVLGAVPLVRYPAIVPVALLAVAPFRLPVELGEEEAFLLLPALPRAGRVGACAGVPDASRRVDPRLRRSCSRSRSPRSSPSPRRRTCGPGTSAPGRSCSRSSSSRSPPASPSSRARRSRPGFPARSS